jgi:hypothetical protein
MLAGRRVDFSHRTCRGQEPPKKEPPKIDKVNSVIHEKLLLVGTYFNFETRRKFL